MKVLLDECLPHDLKPHILALGHECQTVREAGFGSKKNGELLALAEGAWDVLLTNDKNIQYQQNMATRSIAILIIRAKSSRVADLLPQLSACAHALKTVKGGQIVEVG